MADSIPTPIYAARWLFGGVLIRPNGEIIRSICDFNSLCSFCNTYAKPAPLASFHAGCDSNDSRDAACWGCSVACHRIGTLRDYTLAKNNDCGCCCTNTKRRRKREVWSMKSSLLICIDYFRSFLLPTLYFILRIWHLGVSMRRRTTSDPPRLAVLFLCKIKICLDVRLSPFVPYFCLLRNALFSV